MSWAQPYTLALPDRPTGRVELVPPLTSGDGVGLPTTHVHTPELHP